MLEKNKNTKEEKKSDIMKLKVVRITKSERFKSGQKKYIKNYKDVRDS